MFFHPPPRRLRKAVKKGHELRRRVLRTPALPRDRTKTRVHAKKMRRGSRTSPEHCACQEPAKPVSVLKRFDFSPGQKRNRGAKQGRQALAVIYGFTPRRQAPFFIQIEIVDHGIS